MKRLAVALAALLVVVPGSAASAATPATTWTQKSNQVFLGLDALQRSQGVTTDGSSWYFSWQFGLSKVSLDGKTVLTSNTVAIPGPLALQGDDHIGDIDYANGLIYAAIEDSAHYQHPYIATYDATTLDWTGTAYPLPLDLSVGGVPWVAVDAARGRVYTAEWDPTAVLNVFNLSDMSLIGTVPLSTTIGRIQGAKIYQGLLYASSDDATQTIYSIDPTTGAVATVDERDLPDGTEAEGLAVLPTSDGAILHALDVSPHYVIDFRGIGPA
jgi:hypothetical protein